MRPLKLLTVDRRDGYYWNAKERCESGEDKCEFAVRLKQD